MKKDIIEILDFEEGKNKVGRPRLADAKTKRKSLIIACISFFSVILLLNSSNSIIVFLLSEELFTILDKEELL